MPKEKQMVQLKVSEEQMHLDQMIQRLAKTARSSGLNAAGGLLEALREALAAQHSHSSNAES
jgi:hypothetical protein